jgi:hypothetical protein
MRTAVLARRWCAWVVSLLTCARRSSPAATAMKVQGEPVRGYRKGEHHLIGQRLTGMDGDLHCGRPHPAGEPVPGDVVPGLVHRGHDGVCPARVPDREPQPPLVGERDAAPGLVVEMSSARIQDGQAGLVEEFCQGVPRPGRSSPRPSWPAHTSRRLRRGSSSTASILQLQAVSPVAKSSRRARSANPSIPLCPACRGWCAAADDSTIRQFWVEVPEAGLTDLRGRVAVIGCDRAPPFRSARLCCRCTPSRRSALRSSPRR